MRHSFFGGRGASTGEKTDFGSPRSPDTSRQGWLANQLASLYFRPEGGTYSRTQVDDSYRCCIYIVATVTPPFFVCGFGLFVDVCCPLVWMEDVGIRGWWMDGCMDASARSVDVRVGNQCVLLWSLLGRC